MFPFRNQMGGDYMDMPGTYSFDAVPQQGAGHLASTEGVQFTPTTMCPKNFIVLDQTAFQRQIMFHPSLAPKVGNTFSHLTPTSYGENLEIKGVIGEQREASFTYEEDSADIDALLDSEMEVEGGGDENYDEDEVSTARTNGNYECYSPESWSSYDVSKPEKLDVSSLLQKPSIGWSSSGGETKEQKIQKMVKLLRGIVPGGNRMSTVTLLDEAVGYLKSMKIEAEKLGDLMN